MHDYVGYFQVRAATDQTAPFDPPAFAISDDPSSGLIGRACASPSASPCDDGPVLFSGATINNGVIQVTTTTNVPTACRDAPTMGSCVAGYNQTFLSLLYGDHPDAEIVQLETCSTPDVAPTCTTPLPPSCPDVDASTLDVVCTKIAVLVGQFTI